MFIHSIIDKITLSYWFPGFQVLSKNILNLNPVLPIFCPFLSPETTKFPFRFYFYLISFMYYYYFIYTTLFLYEIMLMSHHNIKRSYNAQYQLKILYQQSILFHRKFMHDLLFYLCYLKLYVHITIKNQNKGVVTYLIINSMRGQNIQLLVRCL